MGLFDFLKKLPTLNEISGSFGEWMAKIYAKTFPGVLVLHDILIDGAHGHTSQIDLILVGDRGIYVVEMKMFEEAKIYGDTKKSQWYYYKNRKKYEIYSPLKQNKKHVEYLKTFLKDFGDVPCFSIIAMVCKDFKISGDKGKDTMICNSLPAMKRAIYKVAEDKPVVFDDAKKQEIFQYIQCNQKMGKEARREHKQAVIAYKETLDKSKSDKICPYCKTQLVFRYGKNGGFYGCKNFPKCKYTQKTPF